MALLRDLPRHVDAQKLMEVSSGGWVGVMLCEWERDVVLLERRVCVSVYVFVCA